MNEETVGAVLGKEGRVKRFFRRIAVLQKYWNDVCDIFSLLKDRLAGRYSEMPWRAVGPDTSGFRYAATPGKHLQHWGAMLWGIRRVTLSGAGAWHGSGFRARAGSPFGVNQGRAGDIGSLTGSKCQRHPAGAGKGWHEPAL